MFYILFYDDLDGISHKEDFIMYSDEQMIEFIKSHYSWGKNFELYRMIDASLFVDDLGVPF